MPTNGCENEPNWHLWPTKRHFVRRRSDDVHASRYAHQVVWKLIVAYLGVAVALTLAARLGSVGILLFGALTLTFAAAIRNGRWFSPWPYVVGFWLLPCVPTLLLSYRNWTRTERARRGSRLHRSDARAIARPVVPFYALLAWLASRPPHDTLVYDRAVSAILAGAALLTAVILIVLDLVDLRATRSVARDAAQGGPLVEDRSRDGVPVFDFGVGDAVVERSETTGEGYRGTTRSVAVYRGNGAEAVSMLAHSAAWSAATVAFALLATIEVIRQARLTP